MRKIKEGVICKKVNPCKYFSKFHRHKVPITRNMLDQNRMRVINLPNSCNVFQKCQKMGNWPDWRGIMDKLPILGSADTSFLEDTGKETITTTGLWKRLATTFCMKSITESRIYNIDQAAKRMGSAPTITTKHGKKRNLLLTRISLEMYAGACRNTHAKWR